MWCRMAPLGTLGDYRFVVILSRCGGKILLSRHRERTTWETQGGHIEPGETPLEAAHRELWEESGARDYALAPVFDYRAGDADGEALYNRVVWGLTQGPLLAVRPVCEPAAQLIRSAWRGTNAIPSWSWRGCEGQPAHVEVYGSGAEAALLLNGAPLARGPLTASRCEFDVPYQPGVLEAVLHFSGVLGQPPAQTEE